MYLFPFPWFLSLNWFTTKNERKKHQQLSTVSLNFENLIHLAHWFSASHLKAGVFWDEQHFVLSNETKQLFWTPYSKSSNSFSLDWFYFLFALKSTINVISQTDHFRHFLATINKLAFSLSLSLSVVFCNFSI